MTKETDIRQRETLRFPDACSLGIRRQISIKDIYLDAIEKLRCYFASVCADFDVELVEIDGECNHVHLLINQERQTSC